MTKTRQETLNNFQREKMSKEAYKYSQPLKEPSSQNLSQEGIHENKLQALTSMIFEFLDQNIIL